MSSSFHVYRVNAQLHPKEFFHLASIILNDDSSHSQMIFPKRVRSRFIYTIASAYGLRVLVKSVSLLKRSNSSNPNRDRPEKHIQKGACPHVPLSVNWLRSPSGVTQYSFPRLSVCSFLPPFLDHTLTLSISRTLSPSLTRDYPPFSQLS